MESSIIYGMLANATAWENYLREQKVSRLIHQQSQTQETAERSYTLQTLIASI